MRLGPKSTIGLGAPGALRPHTPRKGVRDPLAATFETMLAAGIGPYAVAIGDSITARDEDAAAGLRANSYFTYASLALNGKMICRRNAGIGGNTSAQMLARFSADVTAYSPSIVPMLFGTNDTDPIAQTLPNGEEMIRACAAANAYPILATIPPAGQAAIQPPSATASGATTGGSLAAGTYSYRVSALNGVGETLAATAVTATVASGSSGAVTISWPAVEGATGYRIYGRTAGSELRIATNGGNVLSGQARAQCGYVDTGAVTPSGALPSSNTTAVALSDVARAKITGVNAVIRLLAAKFGLPVVDFYSLLVDPETGMFRDGYATDGTHPTPKTSRLMGELWASVVGGLFIANSPYLATTNSDAGVLNSNPLFSNNNGSNPTGWGPYNGAACEGITTDAPVLGSVYRSGRLDFSARFNGAPTISSGFAVGDTVALNCRLKVTGADVGGGQAALMLKGSSRFAQVILNSDTPDSDWVTVSIEGVVPAGSTTLGLDYNISFGPVDVQIAQMSWRKIA